MKDFKVTLTPFLVTAESQERAVAQVAAMIAGGMGVPAVREMLLAGAFLAVPYEPDPLDIVLNTVACPCGRCKEPSDATVGHPAYIAKRPRAAGPESN